MAATLTQGHGSWPRLRAVTLTPAHRADGSCSLKWHACLGSRAPTLHESRPQLVCLLSAGTCTLALNVFFITRHAKVLTKTKCLYGCSLQPVSCEEPLPHMAKKAKRAAACLVSLKEYHKNINNLKVCYSYTWLTLAHPDYALQKLTNRPFLKTTHLLQTRKKRIWNDHLRMSDQASHTSSFEHIRPPTCVPPHH